MRKLLTCLLLLIAAPLAAQETAPMTAPDAAPAAEAVPEEPPATGAEGQMATVTEPATEAVTEEETIFLDALPGSLEDLHWIKRVVAVFADSPNDPNFHRQMAALMSDPGPLAFRDVVVVTDTDPAAKSALRQTLRPRGFVMVLVGKDGQVKLRKPQPWTVRELSRAIDKTPLRQQELRDLGQRGG